MHQPGRVGESDFAYDPVKFGELIEDMTAPGKAAGLPASPDNTITLSTVDLRLTSPVPQRRSTRSKNRWHTPLAPRSR